MERAQIVGRIDAAGEERPGQRAKQQQPRQERPGGQVAAGAICRQFFAVFANPMGQTSTGSRD